MSLERAAADIRYLLDMGYPPRGAVPFVCNHYRLNDDARFLLSRAVLSKAVAEKRKRKFLPCNEIKGNNVMIDGYNIIIGMESILEKKAYLCDDGVIRDIKGAFRNYRASDNTENSIGLILQFLKEMQPSCVCFLLDSQISKSGLLARMLREKISLRGLQGDAKTSKHADYDLKKSNYIVASSDGVIIDEAGKVVNFLYCLTSRFKHLKVGVMGRLDNINNMSGKKQLGNPSAAEEKGLDALENLRTIEEVYGVLTRDKKIQAQIEKIKAHEWVKVVEGRI